MNVIEKILTTKGYSNIKVINEMKKALKELENFSIDFSDKNIVHTYNQLIKKTLTEIIKDVPYIIDRHDYTFDGKYTGGAIHNNNNNNDRIMYPSDNTTTYWTTSPVDSASITIDSGSLYMTGEPLAQSTIRGIRANGIYVTDSGPDNAPISTTSSNNR